MKGLMTPHDEIETDVARAQQGDREAFDRLTVRFRPGLTAWVRSKMGTHLQSQVDVDDIPQEGVEEAATIHRLYRDMKVHPPLRFDFAVVVVGYTESSDFPASSGNRH